MGGAARAHPPVLRFVAGRGRLVRPRPAAVAAALGARVARRRATTLWPDPDAPLIAVDLSHPAPAAWVRATFEPGARRFPAAATWSAMRTRGTLLGGPSPLVLEAAARAAGRPLRAPRVAVYSPSGWGLSKATCFVFEPGVPEPALVVKGMPDRRWQDRLRGEVAFVDALRAGLAPNDRVVDALPPRPLWTGDLRGDWLLVERADPLARHTGREARPLALAWLRALHAATAAGRPWNADDEAAALAVVRRAWDRARPERSGDAVAAVRRLLAPLAGVEVPRCVSHGDFWAGNVAAAPDGALRVFDWEWAKRDAAPFFDLWTYELGPLRRRAEDGETTLAPLLGEATERVAAELAHRGLPPAFAAASLAPSLAELAFRVRWATGLPGGSEPASLALMAAAEDVLGA